LISTPLVATCRTASSSTGAAFATPPVHPPLVICQAMLPMCPGVLLERAAEPQQRLYDLVHLVVR
jgi:hypothetical protein